MNKDKGILSNLKVIDFTIALAGAYTAWQLADMRAEVWKVERLGTGDQARQWDPFVGGLSTLFTAYNKNKKSVEINLADPMGKQIIYDMARDCDLVLENFKAGSIDRLGLGYEKLKEINPKIVFVSLSGFGASGPLMKYPCYDAIAAARGGLAASSGEVNGSPMKSGNANCDSLTGIYATNAALMALIDAKRTGKGCHIDIGMSDVAMQSVAESLIDYQRDKNAIPRYGNHDRFIAPYGIFKTSDGFISLIADTDEKWEKLNKVLNLKLNVEDKFKDNKKRIENLEELVIEIEKATSKWKRDDLEKAFLKEGVPSASVLPFIEEYESEHGKIEGLTKVINQPHIGDMKFYNNPIRFNNELCEIKYPTPLLGQHTKEVLKEIGYTDEKILELFKNGVVGESMC